MTDIRDSDRRSIAAMIDALLSYAIDPLQWELLAEELTRHGRVLSSMDPQEFLMSLSHAESLAWQMKSEADHVVQPNYAYVLLDDTDRVLVHSDNVAGLAGYLHTEDQTGKLAFASPGTAAEYREARNKLRDQEEGHLLVELRADGQPHRYGYLVGKANFPSAMKLAANQAVRGLMIAQDEPSDKLQRVVQASFGLTAAEGAIALKLASGLPLKETARVLGISVNTARNHLQSIFAKSGVNRQSDLILVITQLSVILAATVAPEPAGEHAQGVDDSDYPPYRFLILPSNRRIAYRKYGDGQHVVLYLHETVGSSRLPPGTHALANARNLTIYAPERPGTGFSDPMPGYSFSSVASDIAHMLDQFKIERVSMLGYIAGAAHALHTAAAIPERVIHVMSVSGRPPGRYREHTNLNALYTLRERLIEQPWLLSTFFNILRNRISIDMNKRLLKRIYGSSPRDRNLLERHPWMLPHMAASAMESLAVGSQGVASELQCFTSTSADAQASAGSLTMPISLWHGTSDVVAPLDAMRTYLQHINYSERIITGSGSLILLEEWPAVLDRLAEVAG